MNKPDPVFNAAIKLLATELAAHGFRRKRQRFYRDLGEVVHVIEIQKGRGRLFPDLMTFAVNYGIVIRAAFDELWGPYGKRDVLDAIASDGHRQGRITGSDRKERWWPVRAEYAPDALAREIVAELERQVFPTMDMLRSEEAFLRFYANGGNGGMTQGRRDYTFGFLLARAGRRQDLLALVAKLEGDPRDNEWALNRLRPLLESDDGAGG